MLNEHRSDDSNAAIVSVRQNLRNDVSTHLYESYNQESETKLVRWLIASSVVVHLAFLIFDPSFLFFRSQPTVDEGSIDIDIIAIDNNPPQAEAEAPPPPEVPELPQITKRFEIETPPKPEELVEEEQKKPAPEEPKIEIDHKKDEDATKIALDRLIKEVNRQKNKDKTADKHLLTDALKERKKELETNQLHGMLSIGNTRSGYASVVKAWIQRNYALPEIFELKHTHLRAVVKLVINDEGSILSLDLADSSHNNIFDQLALKTVEKAAPFPSPPRDWVGKTITLPFETQPVE